VDRVHWSKSLLQSLIHEIRVDSREAIQPIFRCPVGGGHHQDDAVRAPSRSVEVNGLEQSASTLRIQTDRLSDLGLPNERGSGDLPIRSATRSTPEPHDALHQASHRAGHTGRLEQRPA